MNRPQGRVKPLEWVDQIAHFSSASATSLGNFSVYRAVDRTWMWGLLVHDDSYSVAGDCGLGNRELAKAAAEEHYYSVMREALELVDEVKTPDKDMLRALEYIDGEIELCHVIGDGEDPLELRCVETVLRRLAREAGYDLTKTTGE